MRATHRSILYAAVTAWAVVVTCLLLLLWYGFEVRIVAGYSMCPTFGDSAVVIIDKNGWEDIKVGDVVSATVALVNPWEVEQPLVVRVVKRVAEIHEDKVLLVGDSPSSWRGWVPIACLRGRVVAVLWKGRCD